jgi:hypothetical protein
MEKVRSVTGQLNQGSGFWYLDFSNLNLFRIFENPPLEGDIRDSDLTPPSTNAFVTGIFIVRG